MSETADMTTSATEFATSADGTRIAFDRTGSGPVLLHVDGAMCSREFGPVRDVGKEFGDRYTVVAYDRRGRGESGDTDEYAPEREFEDLASVIDAIDEDVLVLGQSSGAALAYRAAAAGVPMTALVGYEAPWVGRRTGKDGAPKDHLGTLDAMIANGQYGKAVGYFLVDMVGSPAFLPIMMRLMPGPWRSMKAAAPTLRYDARVMGGDFEVPADELARIRVPTLALCGSKAAPEMAAAQERIAQLVPGARHAVLDGQMHTVSPAALRHAVVPFFAEVR